MKNFETETFRDVEGDEIPKEKMLIFELADQTRIAVRGSGTEPKIKYYLFAQRRPEARRNSAARRIARRSRAEVDSSSSKRSGQWLQEDAAAAGRRHDACKLDSSAQTRRERFAEIAMLAKSGSTAAKSAILKTLGLSSGARCPASN